MMATLGLILFSCVLQLSTVLAQSIYTTTSPSSSCSYRKYSFNSGSYYTAYKYCSNDCCGSYTYRYCCYDYYDYYNVYYSMSYTLSSVAVAGIVIGCLAAFVCVVSIIACIICGCRARPGTSGRVLQPNQPTTAVTVASVQSGGQQGFAYPMSYPVSPQPYYAQPVTGSAPINQPVNPPPYQPMTGGVTNTAFMSGAEAGAESKASAPPAYS